ncbi:MAG: TonB-dependent receptor [Bacteroidales bacterium]|nr:TonB-dependent receptor [Bacteroidales bacterium]
MKRITTLLVFFIVGSLQLLLAQAKEVSGKVTDGATGEPLPGVNIVEKGTTNGVITDLNGNYSITLTSEDATLVFTSVGFLDEEIPVGSQTVIDVTLAMSIEQLDEIVVVGYGSMQRTNVTGAISSIGGDEISKSPVPNVIEALRGQIPGVRVERTSGAPGSGVTFTIRGKNSIGDEDDDISENEPLIVIDGVPMTGGNIAEINPDDIATIDVLKDAGAASIYGSSGANGVILITTKTGTIGKPTFTVDYSHGITDLSNKPVLFNAEEYAQLKVDARIGYGEDDATIENTITDPVERANLEAGNEIDWHDVMLRKGTVDKISLGLSGGSDKFRFYMNGDAYLEKGIVQHTDYRRYSLRINGEYSPYKWLNAGARIQVSRTNADETGNNAVEYARLPDFTDFIGNTPLGRTHDSIGRLVPTVKSDQFQYNPLYRYQESNADRKTSRYYINPYLEFKIIEGLSLRINGFAEQRNEKATKYKSPYYYLEYLGQDPGVNENTIETGENTTFLLDNILNYKKTLFEKHSLDLTLVYGFQSFDSYTLKIYGENHPDDPNYTYGLSDRPATILGFEIDPQNENYIAQKDPFWAREYMVGRIGYGFDNRYNLTVTFRRDGSSKFGKNNKWGNFPSVSVAWNIHNEQFWSEGFRQIVSLLKYRASYGIMGNDNIKTFGYISLAGPASYSFNQNVYYGNTTGTAPNESLRWEKSNQFNTGLDFGLFRNRVSGFFDYYKTRTTDLLLEEQISIVSGFESVIANVGETKNWGIDLNVGAKILTGEFQWDININWAKDKNEIVKLSSADVDSLGNPVDDVYNEWFIGQDIDVVWDYDYIGVYQLGEEAVAAAMHPDKLNYGAGDPKIRDVNGDGVITPDDRTFLGSPTPDWYGGIRNTFRYKGFELTILFETVQGVTKEDEFVNTLTSRDNTVKVDYWMPDNPTNAYPQPNYRAEYEYKSAVNTKDASFVCLRNVSFGYTLPISLIQKINMQNVFVYIQGSNLKYWTKFDHAYSPESDWGAFPTLKSWTFGAKFTF